MSRIDEALRRAEEDELIGTSPSNQAAFQSVWSIDTEPHGNGTRHEPARPQALKPVDPLIAPERGVVVQGFTREWRERLATGVDANSSLTEQFRRLAATLYHAQQSSGLRTIMVTSAVPGDGKTLTAVNLALVLSESYRRRVLLVDADLRRPSIGNMMDFTVGVGLSETLRAQTEQKLALVPITPTLTLLPAGQAVPDPISGLTSPRMRQILDEAAAQFDWVILDAPPVGLLADASLLAAMVEGTLFVIRAGQTQFPSVQKAIDALGRERILGVVLNGVHDMTPESYQQYYAESGLVPTKD